MIRYFKILRQEAPEAEPDWEIYRLETDDAEITVANALLSFTKEDRVEGENTFRPIAFEHSCLQKKCGACAMVVNHHPVLACDTRISSLKGETVIVEPLRKFPVIRDLIVDRKNMFDRLKELEIYFMDDAATSAEATTFEAAQCLQCGLCLEVCPNFAVGESFGGMAAMTSLTRLLAKEGQTRQKKIRSDYQRHVYEGCGKSLACRDVCPGNLDMERLLARSNGAAIWRRKIRE